MAELTPPTRDLIQKADALADQMGHAFAGSEHLLPALVKADEGLAAHRILAETGSISPVERRLSAMHGRSKD